MTQTLLLAIIFVAAIGALPWLIRKLQQRRGDNLGLSAGSPRVLSAIAVGPHQRVVTVEVGSEGERVVLVLGVTAQQIQCLHTIPSGAVDSTRSFGNELAKVEGHASHSTPRKQD